VSNWVTKPIQFLHHFVSSKLAIKSNSNNFFYYSPNVVLKHFKEIKNFAFGESELPCLACEMGFNGGDSLLRWKAESSLSWSWTVVFMNGGMTGPSFWGSKLRDITKMPLPSPLLKNRRCLWLLTTTSVLLLIVVC
jgi:hypothetical protein